MDALNPVLDFALVMGSAALVALVFNRLRLPLAPGYIIAGLILSWVATQYDIIASLSTIDVLSQLGMVLLLFTIGLQFSLRKLKECGFLILFIGIVEVSVSLVAGYWIGILLGWSQFEAMALGGIISISSTVIIVKSLHMKKRWTTYTHLILGVLIVEDAVAIILITFFSSIHEGSSFTAEDVLLIITRIVLFIVASLGIGLYIVPRAIDRIAELKSPEVLTITVLGLCFGMAGFAYILGLSTSIGGFVMGVMIGASRSFRKVNSMILSIRDFFIAMFFITIGFYIAPATLWEALPLALLVVGLFIGIKFLSCVFASVLGGRDRITSIRIGFGMLAIGEFSFVIAQTANASGLVNKPLLAIAVIASFATSAMLPYFVRGGDNLIRSRIPGDPDTLELYTCVTAGWLERLSAKMSKEMRRSIRDFALKMAVSAVIIALTLWVVRWLQPNVPGIADYLGIGTGTLWAIILMVAIIGLLIQAVLMARRIKDFMEHLVKDLISSSEGAQAVGSKVISKMLQNIAGATLAVGLMLILTFFLPSVPAQSLVSGISIIVLLVIMAWLMGDSLKRLNHRVEALFRTSFTGDKKIGKRKIRGSLDELQEDIVSRGPME